MKILETERDPREAILAALAPEQAMADEGVRRTVGEIIEQVKTGGDATLLELGRRFDSPELAQLRVSEAEFQDAYSAVRPELLQALRTAKANIETFHRRQIQNSWIEFGDKVTYGQLVRPIGTVGIYAPAAKAPLPSTVLMTAVPAVVAGVRRIVLCVPAQSDGNVNAAMLVAAGECGVRDVFKVGGAQAAAAMAYGTQTVPKVDKIVGPGNIYFNEGKRQLAGVVGIDQFAGPSEILVIADDSADPAFIAADVLSQAEHAPDSRCVLVTPSRKLAAATLEKVKSRTAVADRRDIIQKSLDQFGVIVIARDLAECIELADVFAPEHLEIQTADPWSVVSRINNAGTIMVGRYTPVPVCDFAAGPNHTLPTAGTARFGSALSVDDFIKKSGLLSLSPEGLADIAPTVLELAEAERLPAHGNTVRVRLQDQRTNNGGTDG